MCALGRLRLSIFLVAMIVGTASFAHAASEAKQVLLIQSFDQARLTFGVLTDNFKAELSRRLPQPLNFVEFSLAPAGFRDTPESSVAAYLRSLFVGRRTPDLIVTIGAPAALFGEKHAGEIFPHVPVLMIGVDARFLRGVSLPDNVTVLAVSHDVSQMIDTIRRLLPETTHVFVVVGTSQLEQAWRDVIRIESVKYPQLTVAWANELSFAEMLNYTTSMPQHSAILFSLFNVDARGVAYDEDRVLADLHAVARAPIFGFQSSQLGHGIVGGSLMSIDTLSRHATDGAVRILTGEPPGRIQLPTVFSGAATFDWRELHRWGVDESRLPPSSAMLFRTPTLWQRDKGVLLTSTGIGLVEGLLVVGLVVNLTRRKRMERSLRDSEERFRLLASAAPVMIWTAGSDMRCTGVNARWLDFTGRSLTEELGRGWMASVHPDDEAECHSAYLRALDDHEPFRLEYRLRHHDGEYRWVLHNGVPQFNTDGTFAGYIGSTLDVTDQKTARAALSNLSQRLMDAQEQERARLARELHDDVAQRLALITLELDQLRSIAPADTRPPVVELWSQCTALLKDIQNISRRFHSDRLDYLGLASAAAHLCESLSEKWTVDITFTQDGVLSDIDKDVSRALFRVLQEALTNATKHSSAKDVLVALRGTPQDIELEISDNGCGFDVGTASRGHGLGLVSMRERLKLVGGVVIIQSRPGVGTTIRAIAPLGGLKPSAGVERVH